MKLRSSQEQRSRSCVSELRVVASEVASEYVVKFYVISYHGGLVELKLMLIIEKYLSCEFGSKTV